MQPAELAKAVARRLVILAVALTISAPQISAGGLFLVEDRLSNWLTLEQIRERVSMALPRGSPLSVIDQYFAENKIEHSYYEKTNQVFARIDNIRGGQPPITKGAQIIITLDKSKALDSIEVKPVFTGP